MSPNEPKGFGAALRELSNVLKLAGGDGLGSQVDQLAGIFDAASDKTTAAALKKLEKAAPAEGNRELATLAPLLKQTQLFASSVAATKFSAHLAKLGEILDRNSASDIATFVERSIAILNAPSRKSSKVPKPPVREDVVRQFVHRLEQSLGNEGFEVEYRRLEDDTAATPDEVIAIAKRFTVEKPRSKEKALAAIWKRHHSLMGFREKSESRAGRSAA